MRLFGAIFPISIVVVAVVFIFIRSEDAPKINGVSLVSPPRKIASEKLGELQRIHASWVAVIPYGFSMSGQPSVTFDHERQWWGERTEGACKLIKYAQQYTLKVMLKPHVWVIGEGWTGDFTLSKEEDWKKWEEDYTKYILHYAKVADSMHVDLFCIGTEYRMPARRRPDFWRNLITQIKEVYQGPLTYASNWDNYPYINWWDNVDFIGIDAYFPLAEGDDPTIEELKAGWIPIARDLLAFSKKWNKKILFTEYGFQSVNGGAGKHWEIDPSHKNANMDVQHKAYKATFESIWETSWFAGGFLWKWHLTVSGAESNRTRFTPQGKPAEKIIAKWYKKE